MSEIKSFSDYTSKYNSNVDYSALFGDTSQKLTLMKTSADSLKKSADALNDASLWEKKKIKKRDEKTGEETEVEDYDWDAITKKVKSFIGDYNDVVKEAGESKMVYYVSNGKLVKNACE